ncbi:uncharacterized protein LOC124896744 [Capsicum annuum]|uniref:uncharacterized protein LOC124896744 n=1 Tax=Capsicum annuum TaxID=4072 RepID=UPI001FB0C808|nr:uncharacterized protein LOC124896744 [Capsicum annuum]
MVYGEGTPKVVKGDEMQCDPLSLMKMPPPFRQRLKKKEENIIFKKFLTKLSNLPINIPLLEAIQQIPGYAKIMKTLMSKKCVVDGEIVEVTHGSSAIMTSAMVEKKKDPGAFTIPYTIRTHKFDKGLCELGASINLMPYAIYQNLGLGIPTPITMGFLIADCLIKKLVGVLNDVLVMVDHFILSTNFVVLDCGIDQEISFILGMPFFETRRVIVYME